jgi:hypothetical protein
MAALADDLRTRHPSLSEILSVGRAEWRSRLVRHHGTTIRPATASALDQLSLGATSSDVNR